MGLVVSFSDWVAAYGTVTLAHDGAGTSTLTSGYSLDSLKTRQAGDICRITRTGFGSTIIRIDFSQGHSDAMCSGIVNIIDAAGETNEIVFKTFATTTARTTSSTYSVSPAILPGFAIDELGQLIAADLHDVPAGSINRLEVWITKSAGYGLGEDFDIGRIRYAPAFQSAKATGAAWDSGPEDSGGVSLSRGGQAYPQVGVVSRSLRIPIPIMEGAEIYGSSYAGTVGAKSTVPLELGVHSVGKTGDILAFQEDGSTPMRPIYGHFEELPRFVSLGANNYEASLLIREER